MSKKIYVKNVEVASKSYADSSFEAARSYTDTKTLQAIDTSNAATDEKLLGYVSKYECTEAEYTELTPQQKALYDLFIINPNPAPVEEYVELDYIEPGVEQYIDTGVLASSNIKMDLVLREPDLSISNGVIYGGGDDWLNNYLQGECDNNSTFAFGDEYDIAWFDTMGDTIHIVQDRNNVYINDNLEAAMPSASFTTDYSIYLFAYNRGGHIGEYGSYKLSSCKISENGALLRDYIACYRTSDNKRGLYDRVNNEFYPLQGITYTDVSYIENIGGSYINTGYTHTANTRIELDCYCLSSGPTNYSAVFGAKNGDAQSNCMAFLSRYGGNNADYQRTGEEPMAEEMIYNQRITIICEGDHASWSDGEIGFGIRAEGATIDGGIAPLILFNLNQSTTYGEVDLDTCQCYMKLYGCKIYDNDVLVRNFVPKRRDRDGKLGLYDTVNDVFYVNAGSDEFITEGYEDIDYVENTGQYYIAPDVIFDGNLYEIELEGEPTDIEHSGEGGREGWILAAYGNNRCFRAGLEDEGYPVWRLEAEDWGDSGSVHQLSVYPNTCEEGVSVTFTGQFDSYIGSNSPLTFFTQQENGEPYYQRWFLGKIYYAKIWQNNVLIRDLVPKRRLSDNVDGLYDLVNNVFYPLTYADPLPPQDEGYDDEEEFL